MKKALLTLGALLSFAVMTTSASQFSLRMFDNSGFYVILNHQNHSGFTHYYNSSYLNPGYHHLEVYVPVAGYRGYISRRLIYSGRIHIPHNSLVNSIIDHNYRYREINNHVYHRRTPDSRHSYDHSYGYRKTAMSYNDFNWLTESIYRASFESTRISIVSGALRNNYFTSRQILDLLNQFSFEASKVRLAKEAYHRVVDPNNFFLIYSAFSFESSIREIERYTRYR